MLTWAPRTAELEVHSEAESEWPRRRLAAVGRQPVETASED